MSKKRKETFAEKARRARMMRPIKGEYYEGQPKGSHSTHLMADDNKLEAWPSITNKKEGYEGYVPQSREEAEEAGELFKFDTREEMIDFAREGKWKLKLISDLHKDMKQENFLEKPTEKPFEE
jgi:hypothetical protein